MQDVVTIWDGVEFRQVSEAEADRLVKEDKAQKCDRVMGGTEFKERKEFTGYRTRELKANQTEKKTAKSDKEPKQKTRRRRKKSED